ncbi:MAG: phosphatase [Clostridia bacterium]
MYGVIDIGSNTIRLVIYKIKDNKIVPMLNKKNAAGLAGYIDKKNNLKPEGIEKTVQALLEFDELLQNMSVKEIFPFATASLRNIENSAEVLAYLKEKTPFNIEILSGQEEALFDYYGAVQSLDMNSGIMVDIGGGSTELVFYKNKDIKYATSLPIGSLNIFDKFVEDLIPTKKEIANIQKEVKKQLESIKLPDISLSLDQICGVGGTARAVYKILSDKSKDGKYKCDELSKLVSIASIEPRKLTDKVLKTSPDRIHTFAPGVVILNTIAEFYNTKTVITSDYGVREGYLHYILVKRGILSGN